jgi:hypothetical protein
MQQRLFSVTSRRISRQAVLIAVCLVAGAQATTYTITSNSMGLSTTDGICGFREALSTINSGIGRWGCPAPSATNTINLSALTYTSPTQLTATRSVTINCPSGTCIVDAGSLSSDLFVLSGGSNPVVSMSRLALRQSAGNANNINGLVVLTGAVKLDRTVITGFKGAGLSIRTGLEHSITGSTFSGNRYGLDLWDGVAVYTSVSNTISNNWQGILAGSIAGFTDKGSTISNNTDAGIEFPRGGELDLENTTINGNRNRGIHLGINSSLVILRGITLDGNTTSGDGAGLYVPGDFNAAAAHVQIFSSTISNNTAGGKGGGMYVTSSVNINNSTLSNNTAKVGGGAYSTTNSSNAYLLFTQCTVAFNRATDSGGGLACPPLGSGYRDAIGVTSTIVARNSAPKYPDMFGKTEGSYSLFGDMTGTTGDHSSFFPAADPLLGPLMDNTGPIRVKTHALISRSPAIDMIEPGFVEKFDARGYPRPTGPRSWDVGAYEVAPFETELLSVVSSQGWHATQDDAGLSNGAGTVMRSGAVGNYVTYAVPIPDAVSTGTWYTILLRAKAFPDGATVELSTAPASATPQFTTIGTADLYAPTSEIGTYAFFFRFTQVGTKYFRLKIIGKNPNSIGYSANFDYIDITKQ